jgi:ABC-type transport system substrate-binding protein
VSTLELTTTQLAVTAISVAQALYDTLVALDADTAEPIPYLAKSWAQTPTSITFTLRTDATCHLLGRDARHCDGGQKLT